MCSATVAFAAPELLQDPPQGDAAAGGLVPLEGQRFVGVRTEQQRLLEIAGRTEGCASPRAWGAPPDWTVDVDPVTRRARLAKASASSGTMPAAEADWSRC